MMVSYLSKRLNEILESNEDKLTFSKAFAAGISKEAFIAGLLDKLQEAYDFEVRDHGPNNNGTH